MVKYRLDENAKLTEEEKRQIEEAKKLSIVYDEDCPELTEEMKKAFIAARKAKPYKGEQITLRVSDETLEKAKSMGEDYISILEKMLDKAVKEYRVSS